jgi:hypothetical protein
MKHSIARSGLAAAFSVAMLWGLAAPAHAWDHQCSLATLTGNYAISQSGFESPNGPGKEPQPFTDVGVVEFDGAGTFSFTVTDMSPGNPDRYIALQLTGSGTYTVNPDCTGSVSIMTGDAAGDTLNLVIIGGGAEVFGTNTAPWVIATSDFKKQ